MTDQPRGIDRARRDRVDGGFTLIELMVVIGIIAILVTLSITVGREVTKGGEDRVTRDMLRVLDVTLTGWYADNEAKFPAFLVGDPSANELSGESQFPIIDGREESAPAGSANPTLFAYLTLAPNARSEIRRQIDSKYLEQVSTETWSDGRTPRVGSYFASGTDSALIVKDPWNQPIRFVHPAWQGGYGNFVAADGTVTSRPARDVTVHDEGMTLNQKYYRSFRSATGGRGDGDEGLCPGNRPYFYSAGRDTDPGTRDDNIYAEPPSFPPETAKLK